MAQHRRFEFEAEDATISLDEWFHGLLPQGRYFGFDFTPAPGLNLVLGHGSTGHGAVDADGLPLGPMGIVRTQNGVIVWEDADVAVGALNPGSPGQRRIDMVVLEHHYTPSPGGAQAVYKVVQGAEKPVAFGDPVKPGLQNAFQTEIGYLLIPDNFSGLDNAGVVWTQAPTPNFSGVAPAAFPDNVAFLNQIQAFTAFHQFSGGMGFTLGEPTAWNAANGDLTVPANTFIRVATGDFSTQPIRRIISAPENPFMILYCGIAAGMKVSLLGATPPHPNDSVQSQVAGIDQEINVNVGECIGLWRSAPGGRWVLLFHSVLPVRDPARLGSVNRFTKENQEQQGSAIVGLSVLSGLAIPVSHVVLGTAGSSGNSYKVTSVAGSAVIPSSRVIQYMTDRPDGTEITLTIETHTTIDQFFIQEAVASPVPPGYAPVCCYKGTVADGTVFRIGAGDTFNFRKVSGLWILENGGVYMRAEKLDARMIQAEGDIDALENRANTLETVPPWVGMTVSSSWTAVGATLLGVRKMPGGAGTVQMRSPQGFSAEWNGAPGSGANYISDVPAGYRPAHYITYPVTIARNGIGDTVAGTLTIQDNGQLRVNPILSGTWPSGPCTVWLPHFMQWQPA